MKTLLFASMLAGLVLVGPSLQTSAPVKRSQVAAQAQAKAPRTTEEIIEAVAPHAGLPTLLLTALVAHESKNNPKAYRQEPHLKKTLGRDHRSASVGLAQVVYGYHAERCGVNTRAELEEPLTNLLCGASYLRAQIERNKGNVRKGLRAYNGNTKANVTYPDRVYKEAARLLGETPAEAERLIQLAYNKGL